MLSKLGSVSLNPHRPLAAQILCRTLLVNIGLVLVVFLGHGISWVFPGKLSWAWMGAWIGQAALVLLSVYNRPKQAFWWGFAAGCLVNLWSFHWAPHALEVCMDAQWWLSYSLFAALATWESLAFGLFAALVSWLTKSGPKGLWCIPVAWASVEHWWPRVFPWLLGYSQLEFLPFIQVADITGSCGIGFCLTAIASLPAAVMVWLSRKEDAPADLRCFVSYVTAVVLLFVAVLGYGYAQLSVWGDVQRAAAELRVGIVQVNIGKVGSETKQIELTQQIADQVDLVCWPESAIGTYSSELTHFRDPELTLLHSKQSHTCLRPNQHTNCEVLAGGRMFSPNTSDDGPFTMTAFLIDSQESIRGTYHKRTLIPFGEYMPGEEYFPALRDWATLQTRIEAGTSTSPLVTSQGVKLGVIICYEDLVRANVLQIARAQGELFISIINDGSFEHPLTLEQHRRLAVMRAVEHRKFFIRCAGTGISCVVEPTGKIAAEIPIGAEASLVQVVKLSSYQTIYTRYGEWFPITCTMLLGAACFPWNRLRRKN